MSCFLTACSSFCLLPPLQGVRRADAALQSKTAPGCCWQTWQHRSRRQSAGSFLGYWPTMCSHLGDDWCRLQNCMCSYVKTHTQVWTNPPNCVLQGQWAAMQRQPDAQTAGDGSRKRSTVLRIIAAAAAHSGAEEANSLTIDLLKVL